MTRLQWQTPTVREGLCLVEDCRQGHRGAPGWTVALPVKRDVRAHLRVVREEAS